MPFTLCPCVYLMEHSSLVTGRGWASASGHMVACYPERPSHAKYLGSLISLTNSLTEQLKEAKEWGDEGAVEEWGVERGAEGSRGTCSPGFSSRVAGRGPQPTSPDPPGAHPQWKGCP